MREFAKEFYLGKQWKQARDYVYTRDYGLCVRCGQSGIIVHHKEHLGVDNINNIDITLNTDNLELLCRNCHAIEHYGTATQEGLMFSEEGELIDTANIFN